MELRADLRRNRPYGCSTSTGAIARPRSRPADARRAARHVPEREIFAVVDGKRTTTGMSSNFVNGQVHVMPKKRQPLPPCRIAGCGDLLAQGSGTDLPSPRGIDVGSFIRQNGLLCRALSLRVLNEDNNFKQILGHSNPYRLKVDRRAREK